MKYLLLALLLGSTACGYAGKEIRDVKSAIDNPAPTATPGVDVPEASSKKAEVAAGKVASKTFDQPSNPSRQKFDITPEGCKALDAKAFDTPYGLKAFVLANCAGINKIKMADQKRGANEYNFRGWKTVDSCFNVASFDVAQKDTYFAIVSQCKDGANGITGKIMVFENEEEKFTKINDYKENSTLQGVVAHVAYNQRDGAFLATFGSKVFSFDETKVFMDFQLSDEIGSITKNLSVSEDGYLALSKTAGRCAFISQGQERSDGKIDLDYDRDSFIASGAFAVTLEQASNKLTVYKVSNGCEFTKINEFTPKTRYLSLVAALQVNENQVVVSARIANGGLMAAYMSDEVANFEEAVGGKSDGMQLFLLADKIFATYADGTKAWIVETK